MSEHLVFVDTFRVRPGSESAYKEALEEICRTVAAEEPQMLAYTIYISADGRDGTGRQVHPNYESVKRHRVVMAQHFQKIIDLAQIVRVEIYGPIEDHQVAKIRETTSLFGDVEVIARKMHAGFFRV